VSRIASAKATLVSHADDAQYKSPNRMVTSLAAGTPALVWNSASCKMLAQDMGLPELCLDTPADLPARLEQLSDPAERARIVTKAAAYLDARMSSKQIAETYATALTKYAYRKTPGQPRRPACILFITHNLEAAEGAPRSLLELAQGMRERYDHDIVVLSFVHGRLGQEYRLRGLKLVVSDLAQGIGDISDIYVGDRFDRAMAEINKVIERYRVDFCILNTAKTLPIAARLRTVLPTLCIVRESSAEHVDLTVFEGEYRSQSETYLQTGHVGFVAETTRALWSEKHPLSAARVIPNGIDNHRFDWALRTTQAKAKEHFGLSADTPLFLAVGSINRRKNQADLVAAFVQADARSDRKAHLFVVGAARNEYTADLQRVIAALDPEVAARIRLVPATPDTELYFRAADVHCMTSLNESYPRVIVEALSFGLPQIAYRTFGVVEQVRDGVDGDLIEVGDVEGFATAIHNFLTDSEHRERLKRNARDAIACLEDYNTMLLAYETACRSIIDTFGMRVV
jgi:glycosyltransferase involved in cell wall biosynthesis